MRTTVHLLLLALSLTLASCSSTGGPSGSLLGVLTGGVLGHLGDKYLTNDGVSSSTGTNSGTNTGTSGTGTTGTGTTGTGTTGTGTNNGALLLSSNSSTATGTDRKTGFLTTTSSIDNEYAPTNNGTFDRHKGLLTGAVAGLAAGAVTDAFRKGEVERKYNEGYAKAKSDSIKEFYWLKRDSQKNRNGSNGGDDPVVQYRFYEVEVPAHTTSDGVLIDKHKRIIEVVE